ncbi:diaminopropionate ammonia-lyase [Cognatiyoonia koreensis]|uniref:Diaminopropionate ammonia-lyase n=1 Tax=Cognatiyoonia koreensis TaxID=364200 RepID=A0A1I0QWA2_9RHOB|nr:pyridoxal-phosphate dependent enzyme [Cognatiyoonia koreensis]SEW32001.1 diaminopropionate ammonia-lyase [Cognatiyoonia koreensis]
MEIQKNPFRGTGMLHSDLDAMPWPVADASATQALLVRCPRAALTPLVAASDLAEHCSVARIFVKDERTRMGLGSFKALGAAHVIAKDALANASAGKTYVTASAGNHGLSVAAGAAAFGAQARIYIANSVPESFAKRLRDIGAEVVRAGEVYEESMAAAAKAAQSEGLVLLSDSSWPGYSDIPHVLMEGYLSLMAEAVTQIPTAPTHIFLQAGVGGLAAACAAHARLVWGDGPKIIVVEPDAAPALAQSIANAAPTATRGPVSVMGRLDCKEPSLIALKGLARDADFFVTISEHEAEAGTDFVAGYGLQSSPSGAAGLAALLAVDQQMDTLGLSKESVVLSVLSEEAAT